MRKFTIKSSHIMYLLISWTVQTRIHFHTLSNRENSKHYKRMAERAETAGIRLDLLLTAKGRGQPVIFSKPCKHKYQVSGFSTCDCLKEIFAFSTVKSEYPQMIIGLNAVKTLIFFYGIKLIAGISC